MAESDNNAALETLAQLQQLFLELLSYIIGIKALLSR